MKHSNRHEAEMEFAEKNKEYLAAKKKSLKNSEVEEGPKNKTKKTSCCLLVFIIICLCLGVILYFVSQIKQLVLDDYNNKKEQVEELLPQGKDEINKSLEQGEELFNKTKENVENVQDNYNKVQDTYEKGKEILDTAEGVIDKIK